MPEQWLNPSPPKILLGVGPKRWEALLERCPMDLSAMMEMFNICSIQKVAISYIHMATE